MIFGLTNFCHSRVILGRRSSPTLPANDILYDSRLRKVFKTTPTYGHHFQYSVFECQFHSQAISSAAGGARAHYATNRVCAPVPSRGSRQPGDHRNQVPRSRSMNRALSNQPKLMVRSPRDRGAPAGPSDGRRNAVYPVFVTR